MSALPRFSHRLEQDASGSMTISPEAFERSEQFKQGAQAVAFILPSTKAALQAAMRLQERGQAMLVGGLERNGLLAPVDMLARLATAPTQRPMLMVFSDQILSSADASILVRTDEGERYYSPFEAILNIKYGYRLAVWTASNYVVVEPHAPDLSIVFDKLVLHLRHCEQHLPDWDVKELQSMRTTAMRNYNAKRKLRFLRSAIINAYRDTPTNEVALALLRSVGAMEQRVNAEGMS